MLILVIRITPASYVAQARFNLIFYKLARASMTPDRDLQELGLPSSDVKYIGLTAYTAGSPAADPKWMSEFSKETSSLAVARFYLHHPSGAFKILKDDLYTWARYIRFDFGNYRRQDASRPAQRANRFDAWSNLRMTLFFVWPPYVLVWYAALGIGAFMRLCTSPGRVERRLAWLVAALALGAAAEFSISSLSDACETFRHFFLFHATTDVTLCIGLASLLTAGAAFTRPAHELAVGERREEGSCVFAAKA